MQIIVLSRAEADISESALCIADDSLDAAVRFIDQTRDAFEFLSQFPDAGSDHVFSSESLKGTKSWPIRGFDKWLVFYQICGDELLVIRVLHGRDIDNLP